MSLKHLEWRYATKVFDPAKKIPEAEVAELLETLRLAPSSFGLQPWKFLRVTDAKLRTTLKSHAWNQSQITDASELFVLCVKRTMKPADISRFVEFMATSRGGTKEMLKDYEQMMLGTIQGKSDETLANWSKRQIYMALGFLLSECARRNIDACPMEGFDPAKFDELLGLVGTDFQSLVLCTLGYRSESDKYAHLAKVRFPASEVIEKR